MGDFPIKFLQIMRTCSYIRKRIKVKPVKIRNMFLLLKNIKNIQRLIA